MATLTPFSPGGALTTSDDQRFTFSASATETAAQGWSGLAGAVLTASKAHTGGSDDVAFSTDGLTIYILDDASPFTIRQYPLSTAWDLSTIGAQQAGLNPVDGSAAIAFSTDGTRLYVLSQAADVVRSYDLGTAWDLSSGTTFAGSLDVSAQGTSQSGLELSSDGTKLFYLDNGADAIFEYHLTTAWDLTTATYSGTSFSVAGVDSVPNGLGSSDDGVYFYIAGNATDSIHRIHLSTPWDLSTASFDGANLYVGGQDGFPLGMGVAKDGSRVYYCGNDTDTIYEYTLATSPIDSDLETMDTLSWRVEKSVTSTGDDTKILDIRVMRGSTVLAAADAAGAFQRVEDMTGHGTADTITGPTAFGYVNTAATKEDWDNGVVELRQTYSSSMSNDGAAIRVDHVEFTGTYTPAASPENVSITARAVVTATDVAPFERVSITAGASVTVVDDLPRESVSITARAVVTATDTGPGAFITTFGEYTAGTQPADWTEQWAADVDDTFTVLSDATAVDGQLLEFVHTTAGRAAISWNDIGDTVNGEILIRAQRVSSAAGDSFRAILRGSGAATTEQGYFLEVDTTEDTAGAGPMIDLRRYSAGTLLTLASASFADTLGSYFLMRLRIVDDRILAKAWTGTMADEPAAWMIDHLNTDITTAGWMGFGAFASGTYYVDWFSATTSDAGMAPATAQPPAAGTAYTDHVAVSVRAATDPLDLLAGSEGPAVTMRAVTGPADVLAAVDHLAGVARAIADALDAHGFSELGRVTVRAPVALLDALAGGEAAGATVGAFVGVSDARAARQGAQIVVTATSTHVDALRASHQADVIVRALATSAGRAALGDALATSAAVQSAVADALRMSEATSTLTIAIVGVRDGDLLTLYLVDVDIEAAPLGLALSAAGAV